MKSLDQRVAELETKLAQTQRELSRLPVQPATPAPPRDGRFLGHTAAALNGDGETVAVTVWLYDPTDTEWEENPTVIASVRGFRGAPIPLDADVYVLYYETCWVLLPKGDNVEMVQVYHDGGDPPDPGDVVEGMPEGYHPGWAVGYSGTSTLTALYPIWIQFTTPFNGLAIQSQYYGPAKFAGTWDHVENEGEEDESHDERPVFILDWGEHQFPGRFDAGIADGASGTFSVYHPQTLEDSGYNLTVFCHGDPIIEGKGFAQFTAGRWFGANSECETSEEES